MICLNDRDFKITLIKALEWEAGKADASGKESLVKIARLLPICNIFLEETGIFTRREWDTYCTILHIQAPIDRQDLLESQKHIIQSVAEKLYGRQGDNYLTAVEIGILVEHYESVDLSVIAVTKIISQAISDAELFMKEGKYNSAFDRVHTAFHGYLRKTLYDMNVLYEESETLSQLYNKLHAKIITHISSPHIAGLVKTLIRSASGIISSVNDIRNKHSLAHPNEEIIAEREALLAIRIIGDLSDYIDSIL